MSSKCRPRIRATARRSEAALFFCFTHTRRLGFSGFLEQKGGGDPFECGILDTTLIGLSLAGRRVKVGSAEWGRAATVA